MLNLRRRLFLVPCHGLILPQQHKWVCRGTVVMFRWYVSTTSVVRVHNFTETLDSFFSESWRDGIWTLVISFRSSVNS